MSWLFEDTILRAHMESRLTDSQRYRKNGYGNGDGDGDGDGRMVMAQSSL